jgi:hypothetical protein
MRDSPCAKKPPLISGAAHDFLDVAIISSEGGQSPQVASGNTGHHGRKIKGLSRRRFALPLAPRCREGCVCPLLTWHELHAAFRKCLRPPCPLRTICFGPRPPDVPEVRILLNLIKEVAARQAAT